ncbi:HSP20-like chaperone [Limtongia smithiae]|uniref:HSP20-like chaperone n=1 Tax=Limtongia smithiae TaxID=1125753 RepID=UPI0034CED2A4
MSSAYRYTDSPFEFFNVINDFARQYNAAYAARNADAAAGASSTSSSAGGASTSPSASSPRPHCGGQSCCARTGTSSTPVVTASVTKSTDRIAFAPPVDVFDVDDYLVVHVSLPGVTQEDVSVDYEPRTYEIVVSGTVRRPGVYANDSIVQKSLRVGERRVGKFERRVRISPSLKIDADSISAKLAAGILQVSIPKIPVQPKRKILIETVANPGDDWIDAAEDADASSSSTSAATSATEVQAEKLD